MPSLSELRKQIKGIGSTRKITRAMKMVAGARFSKAQVMMTGSRRFADEMQNLFYNLLLSSDPSQYVKKFISKDDNLTGRKKGLIVITGDKGLCGDFNTSTIKEAERVIKSESGNVFSIFAVGRKACDYFRKSGLPNVFEYPNVFSNLDYSLADKLEQEIFKQFSENSISSIVVVSAKFKSMIKKEVSRTILLPIIPDKNIKPAGSLFEPEDSDQFLKSMVPMLVKAKIYSLLRESYVAELSSRMRAMDNATTNAGTLIEKITLEMNKVRQATITRELAEIIGTNEVIK
jgi:F-type H+-transporting ATPase subunit gamma